MPTRHTGTIAALLATAALMLAMPGLLRQEGDRNRMAESLRPPKLRMLTVWLLPEDAGDRKMLGEIIAAFEKQNRGARVFLRRVTAEELYAPDAVLPDVTLFCTGEINRPQDALIPLSAETPHASGQFAGKTYALPLWYEREGLCCPEEWGEDPWHRLTEPGGLADGSGVSLQRLMLTCPEELRKSLSLFENGAARISALPSEKEIKLPLVPETSDRVRYAALCRDGADARELIRLLCSWNAEPLARVTGQMTLPNAFAHTREEIDALCRDGFERGEDPVLTLLRLR